MPAVKDFEFDVFISYSSKDRPWAKQLADDLTARNFKVFYDRTGLAVGEEWEKQLDENLFASQHLIVLWSKNADDSRWVDVERTFFHSRALATKEDANSPARKEIVLLLDDTALIVRSALQTIPYLKEASAYAKGFDQRDVNVWQSVVSKIEDTIRDKSEGLPILVAILATTRETLEAIDFGKTTYPGLGTMDDVIANLGIASKAELLEYYGGTRDDWRPFGDTANIWTVLNGLNKFLATPSNKFQVDWVPIGSDLWSTTDMTASKREAGRLVNELSLVIIDPISLVDDAVIGALDRIRGSFTNAQSAVMVLTPFKIPQPNASIRNIVAWRANSFYSLFYEPAVPPPAPFANFGVNIGDDVDMSRLVLMTLGQYVRAQTTVNRFINP